MSLWGDRFRREARLDPSVTGSGERLARHGCARKIHRERTRYCGIQRRVGPINNRLIRHLRVPGRGKFLLPSARRVRIGIRMQFEWDPNKDQWNQRKHGVSFREAATAFSDPLQVTIPDPDHSISEYRYLTMGLTDRRRLIVVSHTEDIDDRIRIINARQPTAVERHIYEEGEQN